MKKRLFVALAINREVSQQLQEIACDLPGADWTDQEKYHLTLRFIGEVDTVLLSEINRVLEKISIPSFSITLKGLGNFPLRGNPLTLWAGVEPSSELLQLQHKVERALGTLSLDMDKRKFHPHVTLAKLKSARPEWVGEYMMRNSLFCSESLEMNEFALYSSELKPDGSIYCLENIYPLALPLK